MATKYKGNLTEESALNAYIALRRATNTISGYLSVHLARNDLTPGQFGVLEALFHLGPLSQRDLGLKLLTTKGNITMIVDNLQKRSLVIRAAHPNDRRLTIINLTKAGRKLISQLVPDHVEQIVNIMSVLTINEMKKLKEYCKKIGINLLKV